MSTIAKERLIVLCVDRDDDIGAKAKLQTPIIGKEACLQAAMKLAVADPEEADANAVFAGVKQFDEMVSKGYHCEVAVIAGLFQRGVEADAKLREELKRVLAIFQADGAILVSDGVEDQEVSVVLQSLIPVISLKRIIIKHSRSVEESYAVLGRYLRMLVYDPRYSKFALGVPGTLLVVTAFLSYVGLIREAVLFSLGLIGVAFIVLGFGLERRVSALTSLRPSEYIRLFSILASILVVAVGFFQSFSTRVAGMPEYSEVVRDPAIIFQHGPLLFGTLLQGAIDLVWIGIAINFVGAILFHGLRRSVRIWRDAVGLVTLVLLYLPVREFSFILTGGGGALTLVFYVLIGLAVTFLVVAIAYDYLRRHRRLSART